MKTNAWLTEGNYKQWIRNGLLCEVRRAKQSGHLNGYVSLPKAHLLTELTYAQLHDLIPSLNIHGGLTYSTETEYSKTLNIKRIKHNGMAWTFGFDCAHHRDYCPELAKTLTLIMNSTDHTMSLHKNTYRDMTYVCQQTNNLCDQLINYTKEFDKCYANLSIGS